MLSSIKVSKSVFLLISLIVALILPGESFAKDPDKLIFSFQKQKEPDQLQAAAKKMAEVLSKEIGKPIEILIPTSYSASVQGLISNKIHVAYMDSLPYVLAKKETDVEIIAVERRNGRTDYDSLIVVKKDGPIAKIEDLKGKKMAFTSQTSTSGYLMPFSRLMSEKLIAHPKQLDNYFSNILYAGGYDKALMAVVNGQTDAAAFSDYVLEGKKADLYGTATDREKVRVIARTPGVPTHLIATQSYLSGPLKTKIQLALLKVTQENPDLLSSVYGAAELIVPKDPESHIARTRQALKDTGLDVKAFVR